MIRIISACITWNGGTRGVASQSGGSRRLNGQTFVSLVGFLIGRQRLIVVELTMTLAVSLNAEWYQLLNMALGRQSYRMLNKALK